MTPDRGRLGYTAIAAALRRDIADGVFDTGDALPTEAELCEAFSASRGPVRQAMAVLRAEGLVSSGRGRRTVVINQVPAQSFDGVISFSEWCRASGVEPGQRTRLLAKIWADPAVAAGLDVPVLSPIVFIKRLRLMDGVPTLVERLRYRMEFGRHLLDFDPDSGSIYQRLMDQGVDIHWASRTIDAVVADAEDAELLGVAEGSPLLRVRRRAFTREGVPVEFSDDRYLPNRASFALNSLRGDRCPLTLIPGDGNIAPGDFPAPGAAN